MWADEEEKEQEEVWGRRRITPIFEQISFMKKIGLVLSGGGARGFAHLGVLKFLEEKGIQVSAVSGTSAGAIAGSLIAAGYKADEIYQLLISTNYFGWNAIYWGKAGIFSLDALKKVLLKAIPHNSFEQLQLPFFATATNVKSGTVVTKSAGALAEMVLASAAVPVIFPPVNIDGEALNDGGVLNNFPIEPLIGTTDLVIGVHVNKLADLSAQKTPLGPREMIDRCFHLVTAAEIHSKASKCAVFIEPELSSYGMFDVKKSAAIMQAGYDAAKQSEAAFLALLKF